MNDEFDFLKEAEKLLFRENVEKILQADATPSGFQDCDHLEGTRELVDKMAELVGKCLTCSNKDQCFPKLAAQLVILYKIWIQMDVFMTQGSTGKLIFIVDDLIRDLMEDINGII